jgi:hypothetical protein
MVEGAPAAAGMSRPSNEEALVWVHWHCEGLNLCVQKKKNCRRGGTAAHGRHPENGRGFAMGGGRTLEGGGGKQGGAVRGARATPRGVGSDAFTTAVLPAVLPAGRRRPQGRLGRRLAGDDDKCV